MNDERLQSLIDALLDKRLSASDQDELAARLRSLPEARRLYWELVEQDALLQDVVCESAGRDLARMAANDLSVGQPLGQSSVGPSSATPAASRTSKAASAQSFYSADRVRVGETSAAEVMLADGTHVVLSADSVLYFQRFDKAGPCGSNADRWMWTPPRNPQIDRW